MHVKRISVIMCLDALYALSGLAPTLSVKQSRKKYIKLSKIFLTRSRSHLPVYISTDS